MVLRPIIKLLFRKKNWSSSNWQFKDFTDKVHCLQFRKSLYTKISVIEQLQKFSHLLPLLSHMKKNIRWNTHLYPKFSKLCVPVLDTSNTICLSRQSSHRKKFNDLPYFPWLLFFSWWIYLAINLKIFSPLHILVLFN